jgi:hypothetical protein
MALLVYGFKWPDIDTTVLDYLWSDMPLTYATDTR